MPANVQWPRVRQDIMQSLQFTGSRGRSPIWAEPSTGIYREQSATSFNQWDLVQLAQRVGKEAGLTPALLRLLRYYVGFTRSRDWLEENAVVYQSVVRTALDLGVTERQIQYLETQGFKLGLWAWRPSGNNRRFGKRAADGRLCYAYGIDLMPLLHFTEQLEIKLQEKQARIAAWYDVKREISSSRGRLRAMLRKADGLGLSSQQQAAWQAAYEGIAWNIRTYHNLATLEALFVEHQKLYTTILRAVEEGEATDHQTEVAAPFSSDVAKNFVPIDYRNHSITDKSVSRSAGQSGVGPTNRLCDHQADKHGQGVGQPSLGQVLQVASGRFLGYLPMTDRALAWSDIVDAAYHLRGVLGISQQTWGEACEVLGRNGAAIAVVILDRAIGRKLNPVERPPAYFRGMVDRARGGELRLHHSVLGLLKEQDNLAAPSRPMTGEAACNTE
jgi:replication initiation protein RepC